MIVKDVTYKDLIGLKEYSKRLENIGFQSTEIGKGIKLLKKMKNSTKVLTFTANMIATGLRGIIKELVKRKKIDLIITTPGALEHDLIRTKINYYISSFEENDILLHKKEFNRIGNILVPNKAYVFLEKKMMSIFKKKNIWSPSEIAKEMGVVANETSFLYWANKNEIPIFCPGITDGAIGLQAFIYKQTHPNFIIDVTKDMKDLANLIMNAEKTGGIILGGGISKHHAIGVNILRGGFDYALYLTTSTVYDGSLSGALPKEAISWGKIKEKGSYIKIYSEASIALPLLISGII